LLAMVVNDNAGSLEPRGGLRFFASKLAPTASRRAAGVQFCPNASQRGCAATHKTHRIWRTGLFVYQSCHFLKKPSFEFIPVARVMTATMTVRAQRHSIARPIRTFLRQMLNVMNLKKRLSILFKRSRFTTAFALTISLLADPRSHFRIASVRLAVGLYLLWSLNSFRHIFDRLSLMFGSTQL